MVDDDLTRQIKNQNLYTSRLFLPIFLLEYFNILAIGLKYLNFYPPYFFNIHRIINFKIFLSVDYTGLLPPGQVYCQSVFIALQVLETVGRKNLKFSKVATILYFIWFPQVFGKSRQRI